MRAAGQLEAPKDLMRALKSGGVVVRDRAREIAAAKGRVGKTHRLIDELKVSTTARQVIVKDTARNAKDGYPYPSRFEYAGRGSEAVGRRAFLNPALDETENHAVSVIAEGVSDALNRHNL